MYCKECGTKIVDGKFCSECGTSVEPVILNQKYESNNTNSELKKDEILDFKAVTLMATLTFFVSILVYSYIPTYAFVVGCFIGGFITGNFFKDKLTTKTGLISVFVGFIIALIIYTVLMS
jgi:hypothetical protein